MREYRLLNDIFCQSLKEVVLENRGIDETLAEGLLNPSVSNVESPFQIPNMDKAIELFIKALDDELKIGIMVDSDVDGYTSSALMYNFLVNECQYAEDKIEIFFHEEKQHGLSDEKIFKKIKKSDVQFLILPDAGTNDISYTKELLKLGKKVLVLDHHNLNNEEDKTLKTAINRFKKSYVTRILEQTSWNQTEAGKILGIQRTYVSRLINELGIR